MIDLEAIKARAEEARNFIYDNFGSADDRKVGYFGTRKVIRKLYADCQSLISEVERLNAELTEYRKKDKQGTWYDAITAVKIAIGLKDYTEIQQKIIDGRMVDMSNISDETRIKIKETIQKIENEGSGGFICILL